MFKSVRTLGACLLLPVLALAGTAADVTAPPAAGALAAPAVRRLFISGGTFPPAFIKYVAALTGKPNPRICFLPTASADRDAVIVSWYERCADLPLRPSVQRVFLESSPEQKTFEENLLGMDAIVVSGGNTLNMLAIWKAQGIDRILRQAYDRGIILAGSSAGSLCWFTGGITDSRPQQLTAMPALGFLPFSHCPHYDTNVLRKPAYHAGIIAGAFPAGYACDDGAALLFENETLVKALSLKTGSHSYFVSALNGQIREERLPSEPIK